MLPQTLAEKPFSGLGIAGWGPATAGLESVLNFSASPACTGSYRNLSVSGGVATLPCPATPEAALTVTLGTAHGLDYRQCAAHCCSSLNCSAFAWYEAPGVAAAPAGDDAVQFVSLPPFDWTQPPLAAPPGNLDIQPSLAACETKCAAISSCEVGLWLNGSARHGECWLSEGLARTPRRDFCGAAPGQGCAAFKRLGVKPAPPAPAPAPAPPPPSPPGPAEAEGTLCMTFTKDFVLGQQPAGPHETVRRAQGGVLTVPPSSEDQIANGLRSGTWLGGIGTGGYELRADGTFHLSTIRNQSPASEPCTQTARPATTLCPL